MEHLIVPREQRKFNLLFSLALCTGKRKVGKRALNHLKEPDCPEKGQQIFLTHSVPVKRVLFLLYKNMGKRYSSRNNKDILFMS